MFILMDTFRINITKAPMLGYCQLYIVIAMEGSQTYGTVLAYLKYCKPIFKVTQILASVWSLDFLQLSDLFPQFCISDKLSDLDVVLCAISGISLSHFNFHILPDPSTYVELQGSSFILETFPFVFWQNQKKF